MNFANLQAFGTAQSTRTCAQWGSHLQHLIPAYTQKRSGKTYIVLTIFVDDLLITGPSNASVAEVRRMLMEMFAITDLEDVSQIFALR